MSCAPTRNCKSGGSPCARVDGASRAQHTPQYAEAGVWEYGLRTGGIGGGGGGVFLVHRATVRLLLVTSGLVPNTIHALAQLHISDSIIFPKLSNCSSSSSSLK